MEPLFITIEPSGCEAYRFDIHSRTASDEDRIIAMLATVITKLGENTLEIGIDDYERMRGKTVHLEELAESVKIKIR